MKKRRVKKIVFVCTGNTCRSPMAELLFKREIERLKLKNVKVLSAGLKAKNGDLMNPKSAQTLTNKGIECNEFSAKKVNKKLLRESFAIVCMTEKQKEILMELRWKALREAGEEEIENNVYSFYELVGYEILDPYGRDLACYEYVFQLLEGGMYALTEKLLPASEREYIVETKKRTYKKRRETI